VAVSKGAETEQERSKRRRQRTLFDGAARLYQDSRPGYPSHVVEFVVSTAGLDAGSTVLEVGCGTGQLTEPLARFGFSVTAIDIGPSMIAEARDRLSGSAVSFLVSSFEDFAAPDASFGLVISGAAFHWIDPEVKFAKSARLLRPGGWLALLGTEERYDDPFGTALAGMWAARGDTGGAWVTQRADTEVIAGTGLFDKPVHRTDTQRIDRPADAVIAVENTRATSLSWPDDVRRGFTDELRHHLRSQPEVPLVQQTSVTMARVLR
jgi:ubiquinone/menaquinone biosynthesis C-methylase UbiE